MGRTWIGLALFAAGAIAHATGLDVRITDERGRPVGDAVVTVLPEGDTARLEPPARPAPAVRTIDQANLLFAPYIEVFRPGDSVVFRNSDKTRHHVYSFSPVKAFEFMLTPGESSEPIPLERAGVVAVGCNIHDPMIAYLYISDAPWIARSGADGHARIRDLPEGAYTVRVWQPRLRPGKPDLAQSAVRVQGRQATPVAFKLSLLPDPRLQFDRESTRY